MSINAKKVKDLIEVGNSSLLDNSIIPFIQNWMDAHYNKSKNKEIIDTYLCFEDIINTLKKRLDLHYTFTVSTDRGFGEFIIAKVKWEQEGVNKKYPYYSVHIGPMKNYKKGLKDPELKYDADRKVKEYINNKFPITIKNLDGEVLVLKS